MSEADDKKAWKNISHKDRNKTTITFNEQKWDPNNYYSYRDEVYCLMPDGQLYMVIPVEIPSIGYQLVSTEVAKKTVLANSKGFSEYQALNLIFKPDKKKNKDNEAKENENTPESESEEIAEN